MTSITVCVDTSRCVGSQICVMFSPKVFKLDENNQAYVMNATGEILSKLLLTAELCPQSAIIIDDIENAVRLFPPTEDVKS